MSFDGKRQEKEVSSYSRGEGTTGGGPEWPRNQKPGVTGGTCEPPGWSHLLRRDDTTPANLEAIVMSGGLVDVKSSEELSVTISAHGGLSFLQESMGGG